MTEEGVLILRLSNPRLKNAMCLPMREQLLDLLLSAESDDTIRGVVITGDGDSAFSAGADITELATRTARSELSRASLVRRNLTTTVEDLAKPVVAAINGHCLGAGLELALACDIRIGSERASFGLPEINLGVIPGSGGTQRLSRIIGAGWAMRLTLSGEPIDAATALRVGLITDLAPAADLLPSAVRLAALLGSKSTFAFSAAKRAVALSGDVDLKTGLDIERHLFALCVDTPEKSLAIEAFRSRSKSER
jgi:enoyl-CoA hydratase/carnithine racemase